MFNNLTIKMKNKKAFTLIELIVTILILIILWTIAFFSFQWYSQASRNSVRIADLSNITNVLEIFNIESWKYPLPENGSLITFSWWTVWQQGTFWGSVFTNVSKLNKIPTDPLFDREYTYSVTTDRNQFLLWWIEEWWILVQNINIDKSYAWDNVMNAFVVWNYNWLIARSLSWSNCYVLTVPSIISSDVETSTNYEDIVNNKALVFNWYNNIPSSFVGTKLKTDGWFNFIPNDLIVYSDNDRCKIVESDETLRLNILKQIQNTYSWTILENVQMYWKLVWLTINNASSENTSNVNGLATNIWIIISWKKINNSYITNLDNENDDDNNSNWDCSIDWNLVNNWDSIIAYSQNTINDSETYDCSSIYQERTCVDWTFDWDEDYIYTTCVKWTPDNCLENTSYNFNNHVYNIPSLNHIQNINTIEPWYIVSILLNENNWKFQYKLTNLLCNDGILLNPVEDITPILESCNYWYIQDWNTCISEWISEITSGDTVICPNCAQ